MKSEGICDFCKKTFSATAMSRHLQSCDEKIKLNENEEKKEKIFLLRASSGLYFVYFEVNSNNKLEEIDDFLRNLWLECCGHMSLFKINGLNYASSPDPEFKERNMKAKIGDVISPGLKFNHEYDFGTTTELSLTCISERLGILRDIKIVSRNNMPDFKCDICGNVAKDICSDCVYENKGLLCKKCSKNHECGEDILLPLVNSPRSGMCGYTG